MDKNELLGKVNADVKQVCNNLISTIEDEQELVLKIKETYIKAFNYLYKNRVLDLTDYYILKKENVVFPMRMAEDISRFQNDGFKIVSKIMISEIMFGQPEEYAK